MPAVIIRSFVYSGIEQSAIRSHGSDMQHTIWDWLRGLGLDRYAPRFLEQAIDFDILADLSDQDLDRLGVTLGDRRRMLRAIAELDSARSAGTAGRAHPARPDGGERRHLTVLFCDLVGSTRLSARHDPEDMRAIIRAFQDACAGVVARYDGFVAKFMGDGALVYFGYPRAHEGDAERAVRAGLEIAVAVERLVVAGGEQLSVRVGIATGLVVVGDVVGDGVAREQAVVGDAPNLAARLQGIAEPGTVVLAASTRRLLGRLFALRELGLQAVKGLAEPAAAWVVEGVAQFETRFESERATGLTPFIGRESEARLLGELWQTARAGTGQVVLVTGEAGIGKSRFVRQFDEHLAGQHYARLRYQCSPYHASSALHPFIEQLKRLAGIDASDPPAVQLDRLEGLLGEGPPIAGAAPATEFAPLFAAMLSIPSADRYRPLGQSAAQQRRRILAALLDQLERLARKEPLLLLFEDAHWADATSLEVINLAIERIRDLPVLALLTCRPEFESPWSGLPNVATITLGRLDRAHVAGMIGAVAGGKALPQAVIEQIATNTDGVPLFVEELTKMVLESGLLVEADARFRLQGPWRSISIPATLQDSLMARLDRLAPERDVAQIAATIGRDFPYDLLHAVAGCDKTTLDAALTRLEDAELLFRTSPSPHAQYRFKHSLVQNAAYETLLKSRRQALHVRIAEALRDRFPLVAETEPEMVAHHLSRGGLEASAVQWWSRAGQRALDRSAHVEAIAHYGNAIALADALGEPLLNAPERLRLQIAYGQALVAAHSHGAPVITAAFARARELVEQVEDAAERFAVYYGLWAGRHVRGDLVSARAMAAALLADAERQPPSPELGLAHRALGTTCWAAGELAQARAHLERALALRDLEAGRSLSQQYGLEPSVGAMMQLAIVLWEMGDAVRAAALAEQGLAIATRTDHTPTMAYALGWTCLLATLRRDPVGAGAHAEALVKLSRDHALPIWQALGTLFQGWAGWQVGDRQVGLDQMREILTGFREQGLFLYMTFFPAILADAEASAGDPQAATTTLEQAIVDTERSGQRWYAAELHRSRAVIELRRPGSSAATAEAGLNHALALARSQQAYNFELRAAEALCALYRDTGRAPMCFGVQNWL